MNWKRFSAAALALAMLVVAGCGGTKKEEPKPAEQPQPAAQTPAPAPKKFGGIEKIVVGFVPSQDAASIPEKVKPMMEFLATELGIKVDSFVGTNYIAAVEAMGAKQVDVGFWNTLSYVMANADYGARVILKTVRRGATQYRAQLNTRADDNIPVCDPAKDKTCKATLDALKGKKLAFVDAASTSGYLYPADFLKSAGIDIEKGKYFSDVIPAGSHDNSVKAVYNKTVDAGWSFEDARDNIIKEFPDAKEKLKVVAYTGWIPNDTVTVRKDLPKDLVDAITAAMLKYAGTDGGKAVLKALYSIDGFQKGNDADYDVVRSMAKSMGLDIKKELTPKK